MAYLILNVVVSGLYVFSFYKLVKVFRECMNDFYKEVSLLRQDQKYNYDLLNEILGEVHCLSAEVKSAYVIDSMKTEPIKRRTKNTKQSERMKQVWAERRAKKEKEKNNVGQ